MGSFDGSDGLHVTLQDNEKRLRLIKRGTKVGSLSFNSYLNATV